MLRQCVGMDCRRLFWCGQTNWIAAEAGRTWFPYFRLYSPKKAFLDQTWVLPDIEKRKWSEKHRVASLRRGV